MTRFKEITDVWQFLDEIPMFQQAGVSAANFSLDNISRFCAKIGNPQLKYPAIHIAGTNGKGTTAYLLEKIYSNAGYKTGLFTSPHLLHYNERVRVNGEEISDDALLEFFQSLNDLLNEIKLSYFEISTALAFWYFAKMKVDIAIIEVGLGGRLDSTNIIEPKVSVITSIGLDHQNVLGNSIREIAREKAGIIKSQKPVVVGNLDDEALHEIEQIASLKESRIYKANNLKPTWIKGDILFESEGIKLQSKLREAVNKWNVACAWLVCQVLQTAFPVNEDHLINTIQNFEGAIGRFEKLHSDYEWYFSGSHNIQALKSSLQAIKELDAPKEAVLIFSAMKDKVNTEILSLFKPFKNKYFVEQNGERAAKMAEIHQHLDVKVMNEQNAQIILEELKTELVIFTGSFYFYPIVKRWIQKFK